MNEKKLKQIESRISELDLNSLLNETIYLLNRYEELKEFFKSMINILLEKLRIKFNEEEKEVLEHSNSFYNLKDKLNEIMLYDIININPYNYFKEIDFKIKESIRNQNINNNANNTKDSDNISDKETIDSSFEEYFIETSENNDKDIYEDTSPNKSIINSKSNLTNFNQSSIPANSNNNMNSSTMNSLNNINNDLNRNNTYNNGRINISIRSYYCKEHPDRLAEARSDEDNFFYCPKCVSNLGNKGVTFTSINLGNTHYIDSLVNILNHYLDIFEQLINAGININIETKIKSKKCNKETILSFLNEVEYKYQTEMPIVKPEYNEKNKEFRKLIEKGIELQSGTIKNTDNKINNNAVWNKLNILSNFKEHFLKGINPNNFDFKLDVPFFNSKEIILQENEFYFPPYGYHGIGLRYNIPQNLMINENWPYAYRPLNKKNDTQKIKNILVTLIEKKNLNILESNKICDEINIRNQNEKIGKGIYLVPNFSIAEAHTAIIDIFGKKYKILLMVKVPKKKIKERKKYQNLYWIVDKEYVKICRILLKEIIDNNNEIHN